MECLDSYYENYALKKLEELNQKCKFKIDMTDSTIRLFIINDVNIHYHFYEKCKFDDFMFVLREDNIKIVRINITLKSFCQKYNFNLNNINYIEYINLRVKAVNDLKSNLILAENKLNLDLAKFDLPLEFL